MAQRLQNKFLHHPRAALRSAAATPAVEHPHPLLAAVRHLFGLDAGHDHEPANGDGIDGSYLEDDKTRSFE